MRLWHFRPIGFPAFAVAVINWKHQEDVSTDVCFRSPRTLSGCRPAWAALRGLRDSGRRLLLLEDSSFSLCKPPLSHSAVFPACYWSQTSGASAASFSEIIPSKSCQSRWRSVSCHRAGADIDLVGVGEAPHSYFQPIGQHVHH